ncbi:hypothetical protein [Myroides sp. DW712]|uniref:hypothetical protein n=1 Tax=Myroides sp. DW712 TaxID=3389800 RepID=UPI003978B43D
MKDNERIKDLLIQKISLVLKSIENSEIVIYNDTDFVDTLSKNDSVIRLKINFKYLDETKFQIRFEISLKDYTLLNFDIIGIDFKENETPNLIKLNAINILISEIRNIKRINEV